MVQETARELARRGVEVTVLTTGRQPDCDEDGIRLLRLPIHPYRLNLHVAEVTRAAANVDLIQTFTYHACLPSFLAARRVGKPVVCTVLGFFGDAWADLKGPLIGALYKRWERMLLRLPFDRTIFLSEFSREAGLAIGLESKRSAVIPPGISLERYAPAAKKDDYALFVGKLEARKGIHEVIAVARALPQISFKVMGWGPDESLVRSTGLSNLAFVPFEKGATLYDCFARAKMFVFPSRAETFGLVIAEAMASGCAIVSTVPLEYEGAYVEAGDVGQLVAAVRDIWSKPTRMREMGERNVVLAQRYSWARHCRALTEIYDEIHACRA